jgi:hypothetical protein
VAAQLTHEFDRVRHALEHERMLMSASLATFPL